MEHGVGPLGLGTLAVKPGRHVTAVADLTPSKAAELGPLLVRTAAVAQQLVDAEQVYNCLWPHAGGCPRPHPLRRPAGTAEQMTRFGCYGPSLQVAMFAAGERPDDEQVDDVADRADYFANRRVEDTVERDGLEMTFRGWTYSLEDSAVALEGAGMVIDALREPRPSGVVRRYQRWTRVPMFLVFRATKR